MGGRVSEGGLKREEEGPFLGRRMREPSPEGTEVEPIADEDRRRGGHLRLLRRGRAPTDLTRGGGPGDVADVVGVTPVIGRT